MKRNLVLRFTLLCISCLALAIVCQAENVSEKTKPETSPVVVDEGVEVQAVVSVIRESLVEAQSNNVPGFPALTSALITFKTTVTKGAGGKINFLIFTIGAKHERETASTLTLQMAPPTTKSAGDLSSATNTEKLKQLLARAINSAKAGVIDANGGSPRLETNKIEIEIEFAVSTSGEGGLKVELLPLGFEGTGKLASSKIHSLKLTFGR